MPHNSRKYLIASKDDVLYLGDVELGHASEDRWQLDEAVERENEYIETTKQHQLIRQRRQMIIMQMQLL